MGAIITAAVLLVALAVAGVLYFVMRPAGKTAWTGETPVFTPKPGSTGTNTVSENLGDYLQELQFPK